VPFTLVLQLTGPLESEAVLPDTLNLKRHPAPDVYWRSAPEPAENATEKLPLPGVVVPLQLTLVLIVPLQVAPWKFARFLFPPPPPLLLLLPPQPNASPRASTTHARFIDRPPSRGSLLYHLYLPGQ